MAQIALGQSLREEVPQMIAGIARSVISIPTIMPPSSYVVNLLRESQPGELPGSPVLPRLPVHPGLSTVGVTLWGDGIKWRERHRWLLEPPPGFGSLALLSVAPLPARFVSDGWSIWYCAQHEKTVYQSGPDPAGTWPSIQGFLKHSVRSSYELDGLRVAPLEWVLLDASPYERRSYLGGDIVAGRKSHVVQFDLEPRSGRRRRKLAAHFDLLPESTRIVRWFDEATFFTLREEEFIGERRDRRILTTHVTSIRYNLRLAKHLFAPIVPKGYTLVRR